MTLLRYVIYIFKEQPLKFRKHLAYMLLQSSTE